MKSYIQCRGKYFYVRLVVPLKLRKHFNKRELKLSLNTTDFDVAQVKAQEFINKWKFQFRKLKNPMSENIIDNNLSCIEPGSETSFLLFKETFFKHWKVNDQTKQMANTVLEKIALVLPTIESVDRSLVKKIVQNDLKAPKTKQRNYGFAHKYWEYLKEVEVIPFSSHNPFSKLGINIKIATEKRKAFSNNEINEIYTFAKIKDEALSSLILLAFHTGARIEELCQLKPSDIIQEDGYSCIKVKDLSNLTGNRIIPIHPNIQSLIGKMLSQRNDGYLLAVQAKNRFGKRSNALGKRFTRLKQELGFGPEHTFNSIRKTVISIFESNLIKGDLIKDIIGRVGGIKISGVRSSKYSVKTKFEVIEKIKI